MVDVIGPRNDRAEIRKDIPDFLHASRDRAGASNVGHLLKLLKIDRSHGFFTLSKANATSSRAPPLPHWPRW